MLRLRHIEIVNFVCFDEIVVEPSTDSERPLTVIRAENGSGKTTFLRAVRWAMYGERGLPGAPGRYSLHPAWWHPTDEGITTRVALEFETDGSTRYTSAGTSTARVYHLERSVQTVRKPNARDHEPDFTRVGERTRLMVREPDGTWGQHTLGAKEVVGQLLPWGLRDFFVMDADEAVDFVGGGRDDKVLKRNDVVKKTTAAVDSLLGIEVFREAHKRVQTAGRDFGAKATKAIGDVTLDALQVKLDTLRAQRDTLDARVKAQRREEAELMERLQDLREERDRELKGIGALATLRERLVENRHHYSRETAREREILSLYAGQLTAPSLFSKLSYTAIGEAYGILLPLYDSGHIPQKHISFVRELLRSGQCVCGENLSITGPRRTRVEALVAESEKQEQRANYLGEIFDATRSLMVQANDNSWRLQTEQLTKELVGLRQRVSELKLEKKDIEKTLSDLDEDRIQVIQGEIEAVSKALARVRRDLAVSEADLPDLDRSVDSVKKQVDQRHRSERSAADMRAGEALATVVARALDGAYTTIKEKQVDELSRRMNVLFAQMAANVRDDDIGGFSGDKATVRMISTVGLRAAGDGKETFEIYALNRRGRSMPPIEINGASRRVLALAFVLALCIESQTKAPLIADSLLNFMSGAVRRNTLRVTAKNSRQPILLLTSADLEAPSEVDTVRSYGGAMYTLTGQWDAVEAGSGGDVIRRTTNRLVAVICHCGVRQYCDICERVGQAELPGWTKRTEKGK